MSKFDRLVKTLPSFYRAEVNTLIKGLLKAWGISDDHVTAQIVEAKNQLFVDTSEGTFLDRNANNYGVERTPELGVSDGDFRKLVPILSTFPKQVRGTIISLFDVFWGPGFTRANINSGNIENYDFGAPTSLTGTFAFRTGSKLVKGTGTLFTTELALGEYIRPSTSTDRSFARVSRIISDTELELSFAWEDSNIALVSGVKKDVLTLTYNTDGKTDDERVVRFSPNAFADVTAITAQEIADFINNSPEHSEFITGSVFLDPLSGNKLNIRTTTPGLQGAVQITGGTANVPTILNFDLTEKSDIRAAVYELNPNEVVVQIPSTVPILRRTLRGSAHPKKQKTTINSVNEPFDMASLGATSTLNVDVDGTSYVATLDHSNFDNSAKTTAAEIASEINRNLVFLEAYTKDPDAFLNVGLRTTEGSSEYQVTGGTANSILQFNTDLQQDPDIIEEDYPSSYVFDPTGQLFTVRSISAKLTQTIGEGSVQSSISVDDASSFPNQSGFLMFDFGRSEQEGLVRYNSRPNNSSLLIDASYMFQKKHEAGRFVNLVVETPTIPRVTGEDYPTFVVDTEQARTAAQDLIAKLIASGVVIRFIIDFPEVLFECAISVPNNPDYIGSLSSEDPPFIC